MSINIMKERIPDNKWIRQAFLLPKASIDDLDMKRRNYTTGYRKFSDTTLGGNAAINPPPQRTRYADVKEQRFHDQVSKGMGRWYSEVLDSNQVLLHMRMGLPAFNSLTSFFGNYYNPSASALARQGRGESALFTLGRLAGFVMTLPWQGFILVGQAIKFMAQTPSTKYYYHKPAMPLYWSAVSGMLNGIAANMGIIAGQGFEDYKDGATGLSPEEVAERNKLLPDVWRTDGGLDIYRVGTRFQRMQGAQLAKLEALRDAAASMPDAKERYGNFLNEEMSAFPAERTMAQYLEHYLTLRGSKPLPDEKSTVKGSDPAPDTKEETSFFTTAAEVFRDTFTFNDNIEDDSFTDFIRAEARDGAQFITFAVDNPGPTSESFSNTAKESEIAVTINSMSSGYKSTRFSLADGNVSDNIVTDVIGAALKGVGDLIGGAASSIGVSGLAQLFGNALVDIPKHHDQSTANLPRMQYTMELRSPFGNDVSRFQNLMVPLAMALATALPLSTGPRSYTAPFLIEAYCRGRAQTRLGMVDSIEITRGAGNVGYTHDGKPLGIDISFSIVDLSSILHMPITTFSPIEALKPGGLSRMFMSDDSAFSDYLAAVSSLGLNDQIYFWPKLKRNYYRQVLDFTNWTSPAYWANYALGTDIGRLLSGIIADPTAKT